MMIFHSYVTVYQRVKGTSSRIFCRPPTKITKFQRHLARRPFLGPLRWGRTCCSHRELVRLCQLNTYCFGFKISKMGSKWDPNPIGSMYAIYMVTFTINMPPMLAYIPYMDPMGMGSKWHMKSSGFSIWKIRGQSYR